MTGEACIALFVDDGMKIELVTGFTPEHTVEEVVAYAIEHLGIRWPKSWPSMSPPDDRCYSMDGSTVRPWADASEEELGERCNLSGEPSTITLEVDRPVRY